MANYVLVRSKVRDFSEWKAEYDNHLPSRDAAQLSEKYLLRSTEDQNEVVILFEAADMDKAKAFTASDDLREAMQKSGVVDKPDIYFLND
ncbi:MAG: cyclase [Pyrinomonadaceae bacterium]